MQAVLPVAEPGHCCRGSLGFGEDFVQSLPGNVGSHDVADCIAALDEAIAQGIAPPPDLFLPSPSDTLSNLNPDNTACSWCFNLTSPASYFLYDLISCADCFGILFLPL